LQNYSSPASKMTESQLL